MQFIDGLGGMSGRCRYFLVMTVFEPTYGIVSKQTDLSQKVNCVAEFCEVVT